MTGPIRITYRENVEHFVEAQSQSPPTMGWAISQKTQRTLMALVFVGVMVFAFGSELRRTHNLQLVAAALAIFVVIGGFWFWLFKKIGWTKGTNYQDYRWTEKDRER